MNTRNLFSKLALSTSLIILIAILFDVCRFCANSPEALCELINNINPLELADSSRLTSREAPDTLIVFNGFGCAKSDQSGEEAAVIIDGNKNLPAYATNATVFLNGWI